MKANEEKSAGRLMAQVAGALALICFVGGTAGCAVRRDAEGNVEGPFGSSAGSGFAQEKSFLNEDAARFSGGLPLGNQTNDDISSE